MMQGEVSLSMSKFFRRMLVTLVKCHSGMTLDTWDDEKFKFTAFYRF